MHVSPSASVSIGDLLDGHEVARLAGLSPMTVWCAQKRGDLQSVKIGSHARFYPRPAVLAWLESRRQSHHTRQAVNHAAEVAVR